MEVFKVGSLLRIPHGKVNNGKAGNSRKKGAGKWRRVCKKRQLVNINCKVSFSSVKYLDLSLALNLSV